MPQADRWAMARPEAAALSNSKLFEHLLYFYRDGDACILPVEIEVSSVLALFIKSNRELLYRLWKRALLHINTRQILRLIVLRSPLAGLLVDDQLPCPF